MEPLIWNWYAWAYLIAPHTAACNIVERHLKIMQSYVQNPQIHAQAMKDPKLLGGPFIDLEGQGTEHVKALIEKTKTDCAQLIALNNALKEFDRILQTEAKGDTLEALYSKIPPPLKGLIEIVYDLNHHPSIRLIEPLFYNKYYSAAHQSIALSKMNSDHRKFVLSTPKLDLDDEVYLNEPFSSPKLDILFKMRFEPEKQEHIEELFEISMNKKELFKSFFTTTAPELHSDRNYVGEEIRVRYFGHACVLLQSKSVSILIDPVVSYPMNSTSVPRYTLADLPDQIDYVIITHNHQDHLMLETLLQLRHKIKHIIFPANGGGMLQDPSIKLILKNIGFSSLIELKEMEEVLLPNGKIIGLPFFGEHADLNIQTKMSYYIHLKNKKFLFVADSNNLEASLYDAVFSDIGTIDVLFIGMECDGAPLSWLYGPLLSKPLLRSFDNNRRLSGSNHEKAKILANMAGCSKAYVYAMGQEPWLGYITSLNCSEDSIQIIESNKFVQSCREKGLESERLFGKKEWIFS